MLSGCRGSSIGRSSSKIIDETTSGFTKGVSESFGQIAGAAIVKSFSQENVSQEQALLQTANYINQSTPIQIDQETVLVNSNAQGNTLTYNYVLINYPSSQIDRDKLLSALYSPSRNLVCSHPDMQSALRDGISFGYSYSGNDNIFIMRFTVSPADCGY